MNEKNEQADLPFHVNGFGGDFKVIARMEPHGVAICTRGNLGNEIETARAIVLAVNSHKQLVEALGDLLRVCDEELDESRTPEMFTARGLIQRLANGESHE